MSAATTTTTCVIAIDAGTTGVRSRAFLPDPAISWSAYREFTQHYPRPGWVEHDANEIWDAVRATLLDVIAHADAAGTSVAAIGITNQRETVLAWSRSTGRPYGTAIVWQDRRTADRCAQLDADGALGTVRERTGLVLDPYFSGTKIEWLLRHRNIPLGPDLAVGTIDSWIIWNLTGGSVHATDPSNASRTMLFDIHDMAWSDDLCALIGVPRSCLPEVHPSSGRFGVTTGGGGIPAGLPISGVAGDQQAALFGQACIEPGMTKNTYGTGSFVLMNVGSEVPPVTDGMLTTVAWKLDGSTPTYALEGAIFVTGAAVQWLRDGLGIIEHSSDIGPLAASVPDSGGVYLVPAFTGLGSPWWDPHARGTVLGITRGTTKAHLARATLESMALQTRDVVHAMETASGTPIRDLRVDGGASVDNLLMQTQADQLGVTVRRSRERESTALGAALLAGLAEGIWPSLESVAERWELDAEFSPAGGDSAVLAERLHTQWLRAVERSREWVH
jgi:glycerol kinase